MHTYEDDTEVPVKATRTTFEMVEALQELDGAGISDLARHLGMPKTTVYDHLDTLRKLGYVTALDDGYQVSTRFLDLGGYARKQMKIYQVGKPEVRELAETTGEHANIMIEQHGRGIFLYKSEGEDAVQLDTYAGLHVPLQTTALGKSILAHMSEDRVTEILDHYGLPADTENTITDREELFEELETIREQGYATDRGERVKGMWCVAAPITDPDDDPVGSVSVSGPKNRMHGDRFSDILPDKVLRTANVIEVNLTFAD